MKRLWGAPALPAPLFSMLFSLMLLSLMLLSLTLLPGCGAERQASGNDFENAPSVPVEVTEAYRGSVEVINSFTGVVEPEVTVSVVHKTGGKVAEVKVKDGDDVQEGDLLIRLDATEISAQVAQAEAALDLARGNLASVRDVSMPKRMEQIRSSLQQAEIAFNNVKENYERMKKLYQEGIISEAEFDGTRSEYELRRSQYEAAQEQFRLEKEGQEKELAVLEAQARQAEAALQLVRTHLNETLITAPVSGTVSGIDLNPGEMAAPGIPLVVINKLESMRVSVNLTEKDVGRIQEGQKVDVLISALSSKPFQGEVQSISPVADPRTKTYGMKVLLPNEDGLIKGGMTAEVRATVEVEENTVVIPIEAVLTREGKQVVFVVEEGLARLRQVALGLESGDTCSVLEGVEPGEQVVSRGQHYLQDGEKVTVAGGGNDR